jgi:chromosome condensin MukBEF ATPase and DNA-binding subunit MukB
MSGGSLDYLGFNINDLGYGDRFVQHADKMLECLAELPVANELEQAAVAAAAEAIRRARSRIEELSTRLWDLRDVAHDIEWRLSGDYGDRTLIDNLVARLRRLAGGSP